MVIVESKVYDHVPRKMEDDCWTTGCMVGMGKNQPHAVSVVFRDLNRLGV